MSAKRVPERHEVLAYNAETRPPRKRSTASGPAEARRPLQELTGNEVTEAMRHRAALQALRGRPEAWLAVQALLFVQQGDRIYQHACVWFFPDEGQRVLVRARGDVRHFYVVVRKQGESALDRLSLGVCERRGAFSPAHAAFAAAPCASDEDDIDPVGKGVVVRIVSVERDGEPLLKAPEILATPSLASHVGEVIRKHGGAKCTTSIASAESLNGTFLVLRTKAYLDALHKVESADCAAADWHAALEALQAEAASPWDLANRVARLGKMDQLVECAASLERERRPHRCVHVVDDIYLAQETLPPESREFVVAAHWAVRKSIKGTGSIPKSKLWEPVITRKPASQGGGEYFQLMRFA